MELIYLTQELLKIASGFHKEEYLTAKVRRKWKDFKSSLQRARELNVHEKVQFVGEWAIDEDGSRPELFCLVDRMVPNELIQREDGQKTFFHNMVLLQKNEYHLYGQCVAIALLQGSPGPQVFSRTVTEYVFFGDLNQVHPSRSEVPDYEERKKLEELE